MIDLTVIGQPETVSVCVCVCGIVRTTFQPVRCPSKQTRTIVTFHIYALFVVSLPFT